jgi:hypothetical protein
MVVVVFRDLEGLYQGFVDSGMDRQLLCGAIDASEGDVYKGHGSFSG